MAVEDLQMLSERRLREIIAFCVDEEYLAPAQDHIHELLTMTQASKKAGLVGLLACLNRPPQRGSARLAQAAKKRGVTMYEGLAGSERMKKLKGAKQDEPDQVAAASSEISKDGPSTQPRDTAPDPTQPIQPLGVIGPASGDGPASGGGPASGHGQASSASFQPIQADERADATNENGPWPTSPLLQMKARFGVDTMSKAMAVAGTILFDCARLSHARVPIQPQATNATPITELEQVQRAVKDVMGREWDEAAIVIQQHLSAIAAGEVFGRYIQAYYWLLITEEAKTLNEGDLPTPKGPLTEFSRAEKVATERFMARHDYGLSAKNQSRCRRRWKRLHEMREAGVEKLLHYRTASLDNLCESWPAEGIPLHEVMLALEKAYRPHILRLEAGAAVARAGGPTACVWLGDLADRLDVTEASWNAHKNNWFSVKEKRLWRFVQTRNPTEVPISDKLGGFRDIDPASTQDKSLFVGPFANGQGPLAVVPVIPIREGDLLGLFSGELRHTGQFDEAHGIRSPIPNIWLDSSRVTGPLNQMRMTRQQGKANVVLDWQLYLEPGESEPDWRVVGRALRAIQPWEEMVCLLGEGDCTLHQDVSSTR